MESDYTLLPFINIFTAAYFAFSFFAAAGLALLIKSVVSHYSIGIHKAKFEIVFAYIFACLFNLFLCSFLYWYWAVFVCLAVSFIFVFSTAHTVNAENSAERTGVWGLSKDIRKIRGELFNDMPIEKQLEYSAAVKETHFNKPLFIAVTMLVPALFIFICKLSNLGYLLFPVLLEK